LTTRHTPGAWEPVEAEKFLGLVTHTIQ
jgi:hypothetical protein